MNNDFGAALDRWLTTEPEYEYDAPDPEEFEPEEPEAVPVVAPILPLPPGWISVTLTDADCPF